MAVGWALGPTQVGQVTGWQVWVSGMKPSFVCVCWGGEVGGGKGWDTCLSLLPS